MSDKATPLEEPGQFVPGNQWCWRDSFFWGTVGVGSQQPVKMYLQLDRTLLLRSILERGGPWGWKVLHSVQQA